MRITSHPRPRRGVITTVWLVFFSALLIVMVWAAEMLSFRSHARVELQNALDPAAHAAARTLVTESPFTFDYPSASSSVVPLDRTALIKQARESGERLARLNRFNGHPLILAGNAQNETHGELYVGTLPDPTARTFIGLDNTGFDAYNPDLNAVRVKKRFPRVAASSTYFVDRDVIGFRLKQPPDTSPTFPTIPMVPIAILSDPCAPPNSTNNNTNFNLPSCWTTKSTSTWEGAVMGRQGHDDWALDSQGHPVPGSDHIKEITVTLTEGGSSTDNAQLMYFNLTAMSFSALVGQVKNGVAFADLPANSRQPQAGQFVLNDGTQSQNVAVTTTAALPASSQSLPGGGAHALLGDAQSQTGLLGILGQPRIWMLYSGLPTTQGSNTTVNVVGFVVARLMNVQVAGGSGNSLTITLQPSVLVTDTALTNWTLRNAGPRSLYNPYIARLRFVE